MCGVRGREGPSGDGAELCWLGEEAFLGTWLPGHQWTQGESEWEGLP